jgi:hypothetical protein
MFHFVATPSLKYRLQREKALTLKTSSRLLFSVFQNPFFV